MPKMLEALLLLVNFWSFLVRGACAGAHGACAVTAAQLRFWVRQKFRTWTAVQTAFGYTAPSRRRRTGIVAVLLCMGHAVLHFFSDDWPTLADRIAGKNVVLPEME